MLQLVQNDPELLQAIQTITGHGVGQLAVAAEPEPSAEEILAQDQPQWWVCEKLDRGGQEFGRWCLLCKRFLSAGHALQDQHKQRRLSPEEFLTKQDAEWYREEYAKAISENKTQEQQLPQTPKAAAPLLALVPSGKSSSGAEAAAAALEALARMAGQDFLKT